MMETFTIIGTVSSTVGSLGSGLYNLWHSPEKKSEEVKLDPFSTLFSFAMIPLTTEIQVKMKKDGHRFKASSPSSATKEWIGSAANIIPTKVQKGFQSFDRYYTDNSQEDLKYVGAAIEYVAKTYPIDSEMNEQNEAMKRLWEFVKNGFKIVKKSYKGSEGATLLTGYIETVESILEKKKFTDVEQQNLIDERIAEILTGTLQTIDEAKKIYGNTPPEIYVHIKRVIDMTLKDGEVPRILFPLSEKIKKLWSVNDITKMVGKLDKALNAIEKDQKKRIYGKLDEAITLRSNKFGELIDSSIKEFLSY